MSKKVKKPFEFVDFAAVLALPERLAEYLRLLLKIDKADWNFALDKIRQGKAYREWTKSKGKGKGKREMAAPCAELKRVQKVIKHNLLDQVPIHFSRYGCQPGAGIVEHAKIHRGARGLFSVDIINAYPSVLRSRVRRDASSIKKAPTAARHALR